MIEVIDLLEETESDNLNTTENKRDPFSDVFNVAADAQDADEEIDVYKKLPSCVGKDAVRMISYGICILCNCDFFYLQSKFPQTKCY